MNGLPYFQLAIILLPAALFVWMAAFGLYPLSWLWRPRGQSAEVARAALNLLEREEGWIMGTGYATHVTGLTVNNGGVWFGNANIDVGWFYKRQILKALSRMVHKLANEAVGECSASLLDKVSAYETSPHRQRNPG